MSMTATDSNNPTAGAQGRRYVTRVTSLDSLVGSHPGALRTIYESGSPADPAELGEAPRGRVLALEPLSDVFMAVRPILKALASDLFPWKGKTFDHGGNSGYNRVFGRGVFRFRAEVGPSELDGRPTLVLSYDDPAFKNPWPVRAVKDELRSLGGGITIGPALVRLRDRRHLVLWFGLEA